MHIFEILICNSLIAYLTFLAQITCVTCSETFLEKDAPIRIG